MDEGSKQVLQKVAAGEDFSSELAKLPDPPELGLAWGTFPGFVLRPIKDEEANEEAVARRDRKKKRLRTTKVRSRFLQRTGADLLV